MRMLVFRAKPTILLALGVLLCAGAIAVNGAARAMQVSAKEEKRPIYSVETEQKIVSLGINCAWDNADIEQLIQLLADKKVRATFFVVGEWCDKYPESVKALYDAGHEIGTHSDTHADMARLDREGIVRELQDSAKKIETITGTRPNLFRPPSGSYNTLVIETAEQQGFYPVQWDCERVYIKCKRTGVTRFFCILYTQVCNHTVFTRPAASGCDTR